MAFGVEDDNAGLEVPTEDPHFEVIGRRHSAGVHRDQVDGTGRLGVVRVVAGVRDDPGAGVRGEVDVRRLERTLTTEFGDEAVDLQVRVRTLNLLGLQRGKTEKVT